MDNLRSKLFLGIHGKDVKLIQNSLKRLRFGVLANETNEGIFGPKTESAVKKFQKGHNLKRTGLLDNESESKMMIMSKKPYLTQGAIS